MGARHPHEPDRTLADPTELLLGYLDYYRSVIGAKIDGLSEEELQSSQFPSGWTPKELINHLVFMERRSLRWGFRAEQGDAPRGDEDSAGRWLVRPDRSAAQLIADLEAAGTSTHEIVTAARLADVSPAGGLLAIDDPRPRPTLGWILLHVLQESARHAGHLDVACELIDGE